jgi:hypothetical protein
MQLRSLVTAGLLALPGFLVAPGFSPKGYAQAVLFDFDSAPLHSLTPRGNIVADSILNMYIKSSGGSVTHGERNHIRFPHNGDDRRQ